MLDYFYHLFVYKYLWLFFEKVPAAWWENDLLEHVELLVTVLTGLVPNKLVLIVIHQAEPLLERIDKLAERDALVCRLIEMPIVVIHLRLLNCIFRTTRRLNCRVEAEKAGPPNLSRYDLLLTVPALPFENGIVRHVKDEQGEEECHFDEKQRNLLENES